MFDDIAKSYDLANRVLSFGSDIVWRKRACKKAAECYGKKDVERVVDVACGTGDMLQFWQKELSAKEYLGVDPSKKMLEVAKEKLPQFKFIEGYAQNLPLKSQSADFLSITYGIRNVVDRMDALKEFHRVLKKGGVLVILEFTKREKSTPLDKAVEFYMKRVLPKIGGFLSGNKEAYEYLPNSIDGFLTTEQLVKELRQSGFEIEEVKSYSFGISTMFIAKK